MSEELARTEGTFPAQVFPLKWYGSPGVGPCGAQVRQRWGCSLSPLASTQMLVRLYWRAFFKLRPTHPLPLPDELYRAWRDGDFKSWSEPPADGQVLEVDYLRPPVLMARSYFLKGLRYIDERYGQYGWDLELCTQIRRAGKKILFLSAVRATSHVEERPLPLSPGARGVLAADQALGAAVWAGKHYGWIHGLKFRVAVTLLALGRLLGMRDAGCQFAQVSALLSGQKIDGSQRAL
jgi:hypothetical protein